MTNIPKDPMMLLSYINMQLRDFYPSIEELCKALDVEKSEIDEKLATIDCKYESVCNRYI